MMSRKRQRTSEEDGQSIQSVASPELMSNGPVKRARKETNASAKRSLFVRSLPSTVTSEALTELFSQSYPLKHATVVIDPETKQSKGYGFVTFADADDAQRAQEEFHGHSFQGRKLKVEIAEPRQREKHGSTDVTGTQKSALALEAAAAKKARVDKLAEDRRPPKLIVRNLPWSIKKPEQLEELFRKYGKVKRVVLPKIKETTQAGFGFVTMRGKKNAERAMAAVNGNLVDGRTLAVDWAVDKDTWEEQKKAAELEEEEEVEDSDVVTISEDGDTEGIDPDSMDVDAEDESMEEAEEDEDGEDDIDIEEDDEDEDEEEEETHNAKPQRITDNSTTLFIRNLPFTTLDADLKEHFQQFGPVRYARVVMDHATGRPRGTAFVCFFNVEDADNCYHNAPKHQLTGANAAKKGDSSAPLVKRSVLENENADIGGLYTLEGRVLQVSRAVEKAQAVKLTADGHNFRDARDKDKRHLYLLSEGTVAAGTPLYTALAPSEVKMREDSAMQRKKLIQNNPSLHLSLTRLSIRNLPRSFTSKELKALAREAVVGFAKDVKEGKRTQLSKEEEARGGDEMREAEKQRKSKGKGIVRQSKIVFESREGTKVNEDSGAGRSRGYGFVEYSSHRWALMGLRWMNGHAVQGSGEKKQRLIVEFAIENAQVVQRRKEREEKARIRSKEVTEAIEKGEVEVDKNGKRKGKPLTKDQLMAKTRKGLKAKKERHAVSKPLPGVKPRNSESKGFRGKKPSTDGKEETKSNFKPGFPPGEEGRLARRQQIIAKKRSMRRTRKRGGAA